MFLSFMIKNGIDLDMILCPFTKCGNFRKIKEFDMKGHLYFNGIDMSYKNWIWHGETPSSIGLFHKRARSEKVRVENKDSYLIVYAQNILAAIAV